MQRIERGLISQGEVGVVSEQNEAAGRTLGPVSEEAFMARTRLYWAITVVIGIPVACVSFGLLLLFAVPLAHVIAGKHTDFSFSVSFSLNAVLTATTVVSGTGFAIQARRARHHKGRAHELEQRVKTQDEDVSAGED
jgi:hypothetical protein